jgi:predicted nucleotidyltransferase
MGQKKSRLQEIEESARDYHDHNLTDLTTLNRTLLAAIETIEKSGIPYALIGGVAVKELGRPRITHDIDLFVKPDDADQILEVLKVRDFHIERRDPFWLYKAWREEVLVDVIFKSSGDIYFDEDVRSHVRRIPYQGRFINAISPEDFIIIKAAAHQEDNPHHWHDALAVLTQGNLDWEYLLRRAKHAPRRVLSLLIYAQSNDIAVPTDVIQKLYRLIFEPPIYMAPPMIHPYRDVMTSKEDDETPPPSEKDSYIYTKGRIMEALTTDERIAEHDIKIIVTDSSIVAKGEVFTEEQREAVDEVVGKIAPSLDVKNQVYVRVLTPPEGSEAIR